MRVTFVSPFDPRPPETAADDHVGGVERALWHFCLNLAQRGHQVTLRCSTNGAPGERIESGVRIHREPRRLTLLRAPVAPLASHLSADTDLIHVPASYPFTTPAVLRKAARLGVPSVLDFHFEPHPDTLLGRLATSAYRRFGTSTYGLAKAVLVRSDAYARASPTLAHVPSDRWHVIPNGIDASHFKPGPETPPGDYILFVGRLVPYKGLRTLLDALPRMRAPLPLLIAGVGPLRTALEAQARRARVDVTFLGHVADERLPGLYRGARVTVLPSVNGQEAFGMSLLESMACGTAVVASRLPGVDDVASLGGILATPGDPVSLAHQLDVACRPDALPRGPDLAAKIRETYSWDAVTDRLLSVYQGVLDLAR